jgi:hypothetical protein
VSLLSRTGSHRHLDERAFTDIWTATVSSGQPASDPHLTSCAQCRARYAAFTGWLDGIRDDVRAEADEVFPPERLAAQQAQVMRRLEAIERPARVIMFPRLGRPATSTQGNAQRWIAAAAAAGLVIGLTAGQFVNIRQTFGRPSPSLESNTARLAKPVNTNLVATPAAGSSVADEALFYGTDARVVRVSTLQPMDDITPRARDLDRPQ